LSLDECDDLVTAIALLSREVQEFVDSSKHGTPLRRTDNAYASTPGKVQQPLIAQDVQCPYDRVLVHAKYASEVHCRRQPFSWPDFALGDGSANLSSYLKV